MTERDDLYDSELPSSIEAEKSILGSILLNNDLCYQAMEFLKKEDFYLDKHRRLYHKMIVLCERNLPIDLVTLTDELKKACEYDQIGAQYISGLLDHVPRTDNIEYYAKIIKGKSRLRNLINISRQISARCYEQDEDPDEIIDKAEQMIFDLSEGRSNEAEPVAMIASRLADHYEMKSSDPSKLIGLSTGYRELDERTSGLIPPLTIIAGRPGHAKTSVALNIATNVMESGGSVYYCSPESSKNQLGQRVLASMSRIDSLRMRQGRMDREEWRRLTDTLHRLATAKFHIDDTSNISPPMLLNRTRRFKAIYGLDLLIVDYIQLMARYLVDGKRFSSLRSAVQYVSGYLVHIAKKLDVPVLGLAQLGRDVDNRPDHRPMLSDLMESACLEQDSDLILFLLREEKYKVTDENRGILKIIFGKFRDGSTKDDIDMYFIEKYTRMESLRRD